MPSLKFEIGNLSSLKNYYCKQRIVFGKMSNKRIFKKQIEIDSLNIKIEKNAFLRLKDTFFPSSS